MTAVPLLDALGCDAPPAMAGRAARLAAKLVEALLADWRRLREFQDEFAPDGEDSATAARIESCIFGLFHAWASEAEQLLVRLRRLAAAGNSVEGTEALEDAYGLAMARLRFAPERIVRAMEQIRSGEFTPVQELRNELRARLRA